MKAPKTAFVLSLCATSLWVCKIPFWSVKSVKSGFPSRCDGSWSLSVHLKAGVLFQIPWCVLQLTFLSERALYHCSLYSLWVSYNQEQNLCGAVNHDTVYNQLKFAMAYPWNSSCESCFVLPPSLLLITAPLESNFSHGENDWKKGEIKFSTGVNAFISTNYIAGLFVDIKENVRRKQIARPGTFAAQQPCDRPGDCKGYCCELLAYSPSNLAQIPLPPIKHYLSQSCDFFIFP